MSNILIRYLPLILGWMIWSGTLLSAHPNQGHTASTYQIAPAANPPPNARSLALHILDAETQQPTTAQVAIQIDGKPYLPHRVNAHGIHFTSIHTKKKQRATILFARGTGPLRFALPEKGQEADLVFSKGIEFRPLRRTVSLESQQTVVTVSLQRWIHLAAAGWHGADVHLHYARTSPDVATDWAAMLDANGLAYGFFLALKGGNLPGLWARQYAYDHDSAQALGPSLLVPGEEFRGAAQGHTSLLAPGRLLEPVSVSGIGSPPHPFNWPAAHDLLRQTVAAGGLGGPAHGGTFGKASTVYLDALLGASNFIEIANTHLYEPDAWYQLLNCGVLLPPVAGTDLPNYPFRESWQAFFGETRTYVQVEKPADLDAWQQGVRAGRVFVSSGPVIQFQVNDAPPGTPITLPATGGSVRIVAHLISPQPLSRLEIIQNSVPMALTTHRTIEANGLHRWTIEHSLPITASCWLAARGQGLAKTQLRAHTGKRQSTIAHTAAVPVLVGDQPIGIESSAAHIRKNLREQQDWYRKKGRFPNEPARQYMLKLFDRALAELEPD